MSLQRYAPTHPFPPYAFVPGCHPHPVTDPRGHHYGMTANPLLELDPNRPDLSPEFLYAIDLFNAGYYWEAHEGWEGLWASSGRTGLVADFLKGLIKLAAAGVKAREGQRNGVERHAKRAGELFRHIADSVTSKSDSFAGVSLPEMIQFADQIAAAPIVDTVPSVIGRPVLGIWLTLKDFERPH